MTAHTNCPNCNAALGDHWDEGQPEESFAVLSCMKCGHVGVWDDEQWRGPNAEEMAAMISSPDYLQMQQFSMSLRLWREKDCERLRVLLHSQLDRHGVPVDAVAALAREIMDADYHTHPTEEDVAAMGLTEGL